MVDDNKSAPKSYLHGTSNTGFTKVTYGVEGGTRYEYFPPTTASMSSAHSVPTVWLDPDRPRSVEDDDTNEW